MLLLLFLLLLPFCFDFTDRSVPFALLNFVARMARNAHQGWEGVVWETERRQTDCRTTTTSRKHLHYGQFLLSCAGSIDSIARPATSPAMIMLLIKGKNASISLFVGESANRLRMIADYAGGVAYVGGWDGWMGHNFLASYCSRNRLVGCIVVLPARWPNKLISDVD